MNALQPLRPLQPPQRSLRPKSRLKPPQRQRQAYRTLAVEASVKLAVNLLLSTTAIVALLQLLPYRAAQQNRLQELRSEVSSTQERVAQLRASFNRYFDPQQARSIMQEQNNLVSPDQRPVIWNRPPVEESAQLPDTVNNR